MMRKFYALVVLAGMMAGLWSGAAFASYWDEGNDGDSWETAYIIDSAEDFMQMRNKTNGESGKYYKLTTDLDLTATTGFDFAIFGGHFDGQNHTVKVNISDDFHAALFCWVETDGVAVRNLNVEGNVHAKYYAGGIAVRLRQGTVENCTFTGNVEAVNTSSDKSIIAAGGIVVFAGDYCDDEQRTTKAGTVNNCRFQGTVSASGTSYAEAGGIVGEVYNGSINSCTVLTGSTISANRLEDGYLYAGGITGFVGSGLKYVDEETYTY